jgi:hypothetical protein
MASLRAKAEADDNFSLDGVPNVVRFSIALLYCNYFSTIDSIFFLGARSCIVAEIVSTRASGTGLSF